MQGIEWIVIGIVIVGLLLLGPKKTPDLARGIGRAFGEFRKARTDVEKEIQMGEGKP